MLKIVDVNILPLSSKHYSTDLEVSIEVDGTCYTLLVRISGYAPNASTREKLRGWEPDWGMDHTESEAHHVVAQKIAATLKYPLEESK